MRRFTIGMTSLLWLCLAGEIVAAPLDFAHGLFREKRYQLAADEYRRALQAGLSEETTREANFYLAESLVQLNEASNALPLYESLADHPATRELFRRTALFRAAQIGQQQGNWPLVQKRSEQFVKGFPDDPLTVYAWNLRGEASMALDKLDDAATAYEQAEQRLARMTPPADANLAATIAYGKARLAERRGNQELAQQQFQQLAQDKSNPFADDALLALGVLAFQARDYPKAVTAFQQLRQQHPQSPLLASASLNLGLAYEQLQQFSDASKMFHEAAQQYSSDELAPDLSYHAARAEYQSGRYRTAMEELIRWGTQHPDDPRADQAWYLASRAALDASETLAALGIYEKLSAAYPASAWRDRSAALLAEQLSTSTLENRDELLDRLVGETDDLASAERVRYYAAAAKYRAESFAEAAKLLEPLSASASDEAVVRDASLLLGICHARESKWENALEPLEKYLRAAETARSGSSPLPPKSVDSALHSMGDALAHLEETPDRAQKFRWLSDVAFSLASDRQTLRSLAEQVSAVERYQAAESIYARLASLELEKEERIQALLDWGWTLLRLDQAAAAYEKFVAAAELQSAAAGKQAEALLLVGSTAQKLGKNQEAMDAYRKVLSNPSKTESVAEAGFRLAELLAANEKLDEADETYATLESHLADSPKLDRVFYERAWLALDRELSLDAEKYFSQLTQRIPASPLANDARLKLAELAYARGDYQKSLSDTFELEKLAPDPGLLPPLLYRRGLAARMLGQRDQAQEAFEKLLAEHSSDRLAPVTQFWLGELLFESGDFAAALKSYESVLAEPQAERYHATAKLRIAECYLGQKEWEKAIAAAQSLGEDASPALRREALYVEGRALAQQAKFDEARSRFAAVIGEDSTEISAKARFMTAETFLHQRNYAEALRHYLQVKILYRFPEWQSMSLLQAGKCHEQLAERDQAQRSYEQLLEEFPTTTSAPAAKERLAAMQTERK